MNWKSVFSQVLPLLVAVALTIAMVGSAKLFGGAKAVAERLGIDDLEGTANFISLAQPAVLLLLLVLALSGYAARAATRAVWLRYWRPVGGARLPDAMRKKAVGGMEAQRERIAFGTSWPRHDPQAKSATKVRHIHFGDAVYSAPAADRRAIRRFLNRPRRPGIRGAVETDVLLVTGEPGAGKSVLTQEIHASLAGGVASGLHSLIPVVVFAADLTMERLAGFEGRIALLDFLVSYLERQPGCEDLAEFVRVNWRHHDFLLIVDGLDEVAQRSAYERVQRKLRAMIEQELASEGHRVRRFILSCRTDDNIGIFRGAQSIVLKGLATEAERERFCDNLSRGHGLSKRDHASLRRVLKETSRSLSPVDIFRRNPYFLALLLTYFRDRTLDDVGRVIDFEFLTDHYIAREIERPYATLAPPTSSQQRREDLRSELQPCATIFLAYFAYHMSSTRGEGALYGECRLTPELFAGFVQATSTTDTAGSEGHWPALAGLLDRVSTGQEITAEELDKIVKQKILAKEDVRQLSDAVERGDSVSLAEAVMRIFSVIAYSRRIEEPDWYLALADILAAEGGSALRETRERLAFLLFARGLAAAHTLRLLYVIRSDEGYTARFRHRRLAEYFAATYFRDRWMQLQPLPDSPWLTPVLNLVAALEGPRCYSLAWFLERVKEHQEQGFAWRGRVTDCAEATAFAHRSSRFYEITTAEVSAYVQKLTDLRVAYHRAKRNAKRRDLVTELTLISGLDFLGGLNIKPIRLSPSLLRNFYRIDRAQSPQFLIDSARATGALRRLTGKSSPLVHRISLFWRALADPIAIVGNRRDAWRNGLQFDWTAALSCLVAMEILVVYVLYLFFRWVVLGRVGPDDPGSSAASVCAATFSTCWCLWRLGIWTRSPTKAARFSMMPLKPLTVPLSVTAAVTVREARPAVIPTTREVTRATTKARKAAWPFFLRTAILVLIGLAVATLATIVATALWQDPPPQDADLPAAVAPPPIAASARPLGCARAVAARDTLRANMPKRNSDLERGRAAMTRVRDQLTAIATTDECSLAKPDYSGQSFAADAVEVELSFTPNFIPYPAAVGATFGVNDFAQLRATIDRRPEFAVTPGKLALLPNLRTLWANADHLRNLSIQVIALRQARTSGRITEEADGRFVRGPDFLPTARKVDKLLHDSIQELRRARASLATLEAKRNELLLVWLLAVPGAIALLIIADQARKRRRDSQRIAEHGDKSVGDLCTIFRQEELGETVRSKLLRGIQLRTGVVEAEIKDLEDLAQQFAARKSPEDIKFARAVGDAVSDLSDRLRRQN